MSIQAMSWAWAQPIDDLAAKVTLLALADYADHETGRCYPTVEQIACRTRQSDRSVQRKLRWLEEHGYVRVVPSTAADGRRRANTYFLVFDDAARAASSPDNLSGHPAEAPENEAAQGAYAEGGEEGRQIVGAPRHSSVTYPRHQVSPGRVTTVSPQPSDRTIRDGSPPIVPPKGDERDGADAEGERAVTPPLADLLAAWPTGHVDPGRGRTEKLWASLDEAERRKAIEAVEPYLTELRRHGRTTVPSVSTYLRDRPWRDLRIDQRGGAAAWVSVEPWTRDWWAVFIARIRAGKPAGFTLSLAIGGKPIGVQGHELPDQATIAAFRPYPSDGDVMRAWRPWFERHGANLPSWRDKRVYVFLPGEVPPEEGVADADLAALAGERGGGHGAI